MKEGDMVPIYYNNVFICTVPYAGGMRVEYPFIDPKRKMKRRRFELGMKYGRYAYIYVGTEVK